tara:strand:- start:355 stop:1182 length:828 start_codon:yes stop_codon:yes gene_type:complete
MTAHMANYVQTECTNSQKEHDDLLQTLMSFCTTGTQNENKVCVSQGVLINRLVCRAHRSKSLSRFYENVRRLNDLDFTNDQIFTRIAGIPMVMNSSMTGYNEYESAVITFLREKFMRAELSKQCVDFLAGDYAYNDVSHVVKIKFINSDNLVRFVRSRLRPDIILIVDNFEFDGYAYTEGIVDESYVFSESTPEGSVIDKDELRRYLEEKMDALFLDQHLIYTVDDTDDWTETKGICDIHSVLYEETSKQFDRIMSQWVLNETFHEAPMQVADAE